MFSQLRFLDHGGEMGRRIREFDWVGHPIGAPVDWPQPLRFALDVMLGSSFPAAIYWGPEFRLLYNDAWSPIPAERHPWALGRTAREVWPEIWDVIEPQLRSVMEGGEGFATFDQLLMMHRDGAPRETWWNYSFTPIRDEQGAVVGILNQGNETTATVLAGRARLQQVERLRELFAQAPGAVALLHGPEHVFELANPAYLELVGGRDLVGRRVGEALPEVLDQGFIDLLDEVFRTGEPFRGTGVPVRLERQGKRETRILDFVYQPIKDVAGVTSDIFIQVTDVTDRTQAEGAAAAAIEELRTTHEAQTFVHDLAERLRALDTPAAIMEAAAQAVGTHVGADRAGFYRVGEDEIHFGHGWSNGRLPELSGSMRLAGLGAIAEGYRAGRTLVLHDSGQEHAGTELARRTPSAIGVPLLRNGLWVATFYANRAGPWQCSPEDVAFVERVAEIAWDAVERATATAALRESEAKFRGIANSIEQMVWSTDPDGYHDYYNERWYDYTGVPHGSTDGEAWNGMFHPEDQERAWQAWQHCLATGDPYHIEYRLRHASGAYRWVLGRAQPVRDAEGRITRWFGTCTDIQDIVDAREVLARSRAELETAVEQRTRQLLEAEERLRQAQKMEAVGQLTGGIAHDFNNMLAVVIGSLDLLERRVAQGRRDLERYITAAKDGASRAAALTQRLLAFSRQQPLNARPVDINQTVLGMIDLLVRTLGESVTIETKLPQELPTALVDPNQVENLILNLSVNARDAMPGGGLLVIETAHIALGEAEAHRLAVEPGDYVELAVIDGGTGMPPEVAQRAFEPFFTTKGVGRGTGLGLSQVFGFVRQSGGHVAIETEQGKGTTVRVLLPCHRGGPALGAEPERAGGTARGHAHEVVLVVEDEDRVRGFSTEALRELGYTVADARDGPEALRMIERGQRVSLLFTDVVMPDMTGHELAQRARARVPALKVLYTSGYTGETIREAGADERDVLPKPFDIDQLAHRVRAVLDA